MELWKSDILSVTALQTSKSVLLVPTSARGVATSSRLFEPHVMFAVRFRGITVTTNKSI
jgi:hypothetical protein